MEIIQRAIDVLEGLEISFAKIDQIVHDDSLSSLVFRIHMSNGQSRILKFSYNAERWRKETYYLSLLAKCIPVPEIIMTEPPEENHSGVILMEDIPGNLLKGASLTDKWAYTMGETLAKLHSIKVESYGDLSKPNKKETTPIEEMEQYFSKASSECQHLVEEKLLNQISIFVESHLPLLKNVEGPCIVHRDYRPGNIIVKDGKIQAVIDFEIAMGSFAEDDFIQMDRLVWSSYPQTRSAFMKGYASVRPLPHLEEVLPLLRLLKALGAIGFTYERGTYQTKHKHVYLENLTFIKNFFEKK